MISSRLGGVIDPVHILLKGGTTERGISTLAADDLARLVRDRSGGRHAVRCSYERAPPSRALARMDALGSAPVVVLSLLPDVEDASTTRDEAREHLAALRGRLVAGGASAVLVCNVFRCAPAGSVIDDRILEFNRMLIDLSHQTGVVVVDVDRAMAYHGSEALGCDYRCLGSRAAKVAAGALAEALVDGGVLDEIAEGDR